MDAKEAAKLSVPRTERQMLLRELAEAAMSITHHDIDNSEPEAIHEIEAMERRFDKILNRYRAAKVRQG